MLRLLLALAATVVLGLASRLYPAGWFLYDRVLGEVLYAVAAYLVLAMLLVREPPWLIALIAFGCCLAVELFKLTGIPAEHQHVFLVRWFLGMSRSSSRGSVLTISRKRSAMARVAFSRFSTRC